MPELLSSLSKLVHLIRENQILPEQLIELYCEALEKTDRDVKAFLTEQDRKERLMSDLGDLIRKFPDPEKRPELFGIPVGVKDLFSVDGFPTKAGSELPAELFYSNEASCVIRLKNAGALILGKTVTTEFAYFQPGPTRNPLNLKHTPGGSSSGSAAAVSAGLCPLTLGTQTIGSVIRPAAYCGVIGFKPSQGRIATDGIVPFSPTLDQAGYFVKDLNDAIPAAEILLPDWNKDIELKDGNFVLGIPEGKYLQQAAPEILSLFQKDLRKLEQCGVSIRPFRMLDNVEEINTLHNTIMAKEFSLVHQNWFDKYEALYSRKSVELVIQGRAVRDFTYQEALTRRDEYIKKYSEIFSDNSVDLLLTPATQTLAPDSINSTGSPLMNLPWTFFGFPVLNLPGSAAGNGLIAGLQIVAPAGKDEELLHRLNMAPGIEKFVNS